MPQTIQIMEVLPGQSQGNCGNVELAEDFLASTFAGSTELYDNILSCGAISTWTPAGDSDAYAVPNEFFSGDAVFEKIVDYSTKVPSIITGPYFNEARDAISVATTNITNGADLEKELKKRKILLILIWDSKRDSYHTRGWNVEPSPLWIERRSFCV